MNLIFGGEHHRPADAIKGSICIRRKEHYGRIYGFFGMLAEILEKHNCNRFGGYEEKMKCFNSIQPSFKY